MAGKRSKIPTTRAVLALRAAGVSFEPHTYAYQPRGGTAASSEALDVDEHAVIKTLIMQDDTGEPLVVLMHGDKSVSTKKLAREIGAKSVQPCAPAVAERHSGYRVGGTSPFGLRKAIPIHAQVTIWDLPRLYINGGSRGFLVSLSPDDLEAALQPNIIDACTD